MQFSLCSKMKKTHGNSHTVIILFEHFENLSKVKLVVNDDSRIRKESKAQPLPRVIGPKTMVTNSIPTLNYSYFESNLQYGIHIG